MPQQTTPKTTVLLTGGTLAKTYDAATGEVVNADNNPERLFAGMRLDGMEVKFVDLLRKDSLYLTEDDYSEILAAVDACHAVGEKVLIVCGTDRLPEVAKRLDQSGASERGTTVITGAMVPLSVQESDAPQNVAQSFMALRMADKGVLTVFHNQVFYGSNVEKDRSALTMVTQS